MDKEIIEMIEKYINNHLKEEFSLNEIADHIGYSPYHLTREYKESTGMSVMEKTREQRLLASMKDIADGKNIIDIALSYCFYTHAGFTKAFTALTGRSPKDYQEHYKNIKLREKEAMENLDMIIKVRHICKDDVNDLWENVYSGMTPRQITEDKILPAIEAYKKREGFELVAEVDGKVVMALPLSKPTWIPLGFVWDNNFILTGGDSDKIMEKLIDELKVQAKSMGITTLLSPQGKNSESSKSMQTFGFQKVSESDDWEYLMMTI